MKQQSLAALTYGRDEKAHQTGEIPGRNGTGGALG